MTRWIRAGLFLGLGLAVTVAAMAANRPADGAAEKPRHFEVRMTDELKFDPETVEIATGDTITWIADSMHGHTATPDKQGDFEEQKVMKGKFSKRVKFEKEGEFPYHCVPHKDSGMTGKVVVKKQGT